MDFQIGRMAFQGARTVQLPWACDDEAAKPARTLLCAGGRGEPSRMMGIGQSFAGSRMRGVPGIDLASRRRWLSDFSVGSAEMRWRAVRSNREYGATDP